MGAVVVASGTIRWQQHDLPLHPIRRFERLDGGLDLRGRAHAKGQDFLFGLGMHFQHRTEGGMDPSLF